jgi:hypothetical protein
MNNIFTKVITGITNQTLQSFSSLSTLLSSTNNNFIKKITFILEPNSVLTAQSAIQNTSCFFEAGTDVKIAQNPIGATTNVYFDIQSNNAIGETLDLRTALKFTATGTVSVILYF